MKLDHRSGEVHVENQGTLKNEVWTGINYDTFSTQWPVNEHNIIFNVFFMRVSLSLRKNMLAWVHLVGGSNLDE